MKTEINSKLEVKMIWSFFSILLLFQVVIEKTLGVKLFILGINANFIKLILFLILLLSPIYFFDYEKDMEMKKIYRVISIMSVIPMLLLYALTLSGDKCFYFKAPYEHSYRELIVEETAGSSSFYERKYIIFIKPIDGYILTDNGYRPFSTDTAEVKWLDENSVKLDYAFSSRGGYKTEIIRFN